MYAVAGLTSAAPLSSSLAFSRLSSVGLAASVGDTVQQEAILSDDGVSEGRTIGTESRDGLAHDTEKPGVVYERRLSVSDLTVCG